MCVCGICVYVCVYVCVMCVCVCGCHTRVGGLHNADFLTKQSAIAEYFRPIEVCGALNDKKGLHVAVMDIRCIFHDNV